MIRLLVATLLLAAIAVTVRLKARGTGTTRSIKISARAAVNRGAVIAIVEAEGRRLLIGAAANQVNILADLGAVGPIDDVVVDESTRSSAPTFASRMVVPRRSPKACSATGDTFVQRVRRLTVRTADPMHRPRLTEALREETRRTS
ncbi:MAG: hypothetical protein QOE00_222 [Ilumatobacteraceae bacterium]|jgi:flagellar biogenesis protein FliO